MNIDQWAVGGFMIFRVSGEIDHAYSGQLIEGVEDRWTPEDGSLYLDLTEVEYLDSGGLAALYQLLGQIPDGERLAVVTPLNAIRRTFEIAGLSVQPKFRVVSSLEGLQGLVDADFQEAVRSAPETVSLEECRTVSGKPSPSWGHLGSFEMAPNLDELAQVRRFVEEVTAKLALNSDRAYNLKLAVSEACANAVEHGMGEPREVMVSAVCDGSELRVTIDGGRDFQLQGNHAAEGRNAHRGLGLPLMVALMDEVRICRSLRGGTEVELTLFLDAPAAHPA